MSAATLKDFLIAYIFTAVCLLVVGFVLEQIAGWDVGSAAQFAPLFFAALRAAHCHVKRGGAVPEGAIAWQASRHMALASTTVASAFLLIEIALFGVESFVAEDLSDQTTSMIIVAALALSYGFDLLLLRFTFPWMVRHQIEMSQRNR